MKHKLLTILCLFTVISAAARDNARVLKFNKNGEFKIAQFTDMHLDARSEYRQAQAEKTFARLSRVIREEKPDFVAFTGDVVTGKPASLMWNRLLDSMAVYKVPFCVVLGNHDAEQDLTRQQIAASVVASPYSLNKINSGGELADIAVEVAASRRKSTAAVLYFMDSHDYSTIDSIDGYGWFTPEQVQWLRNDCESRLQHRQKTPIPALAFFHIPLQEYSFAWDNEYNTRIGRAAEDECPGELNTGMYAAMVETGSVMGTFVGHDHDIDYVVTQNGIALGYGRFSGDDTTYNNLRPGVRLIVLTEGECEFRTWIREDDGRLVDKVVFKDGKIGKIAKADKAAVAIIPTPEYVSAGQSSVIVKPEISIAVQDGDVPGMEFAVAALKDVLREVFGNITMASGTGEKCTEFSFSLNESLPESGYRLEVSPKGVRIEGGDAAGCFYAVQTLRQLIPGEVYSAQSVPSFTLQELTVRDSPCMGYRGMMLDVARHFFTVEEVKKVLDIMAMHKLNIFHWHLTDDQGWRIEVDAYPRLTTVGSVRKRTIVGKDPGGEYDGNTKYDETPHGGFYTKSQIREIVEYAKARFITVIPEIEFPGHAVAALASYPWLSCTGEEYEVRQTWDIDDRVFCIGRESTFKFMEDVLDEVLELFPSEYIHLGGDECPDKMWQKCPECLKRMENESLPSFRALQGYGMARLGTFLESRGRHLIGWDEILEAGVSPSSIVMSWRGTEGGIVAARSGNRAVMCPTEYCYFDYYQFEDTENEPLAWGGLITLDKAWSFDPYAGLDEASQNNIIGIQANLWTEYISDIPGLEYMMLPRLAALAENAWSIDRKDYDRFLSGLPVLTSIYDFYGLKHAYYSQNEE